MTMSAGPVLAVKSDLGLQALPDVRLAGGLLELQADPAHPRGLMAYGHFPSHVEDALEDQELEQSD